MQVFVDVSWETLDEDSDDEAISLGDLPTATWECTAFEGMHIFIKLLSDKSTYGINISQAMVWHDDDDDV